MRPIDYAVFAIFVLTVIASMLGFFGDGNRNAPNNPPDSLPGFAVPVYWEGQKLDRSRDQKIFHLL